MSSTFSHLAETFYPQSLKGYVEKKNLSIRKNEINSQKCRHRYLPKYRTMIKDLDKHCIVERRIGILYKERLESIVQMLIERCSVGEVVSSAVDGIHCIDDCMDDCRSHCSHVLRCLMYSSPGIRRQRGLGFVPKGYRLPARSRCAGRSKGENFRQWQLIHSIYT